MTWGSIREGQWDMNVWTTCFGWGHENLFLGHEASKDSGIKHERNRSGKHRHEQDCQQELSEVKIVDFGLAKLRGQTRK